MGIAQAESRGLERNRERCPVTTLHTTCPKCGQPMALPLPEGADLDAAKRLAKAIACAACWDRLTPESYHDAKPKAAPAAKRGQLTMPYRDD